MKNKILFTLLLLIASFSLFAQTYITNVTVADVENQKMVPDQTVVITNDIITKIQSSKILSLIHI